LCEITDPAFDAQMDVSLWPELKVKIAEIFSRKTQREWCTLMEGSEVCFAPVLDMAEAPHHPHNLSRGSFIDVDGVTQPAPAPHFSRSTPEVSAAPAKPGQHSAEILKDWHIPPETIIDLRNRNVI
jgi:alpha-methylacyl-CoA racemase